MHTSAWLTTPVATHQRHERALARSVSAGLPSAYAASALAWQEQQRQALVDVACARQFPSPSPFPTLRAYGRQIERIARIWARLQLRSHANSVAIGRPC